MRLYTFLKGLDHIELLLILSSEVLTLLLANRSRPLNYLVSL